MPDKNKAIKNPGLLLAIRVMRENPTPENQSRMIDEMMKAKFLAPAVIEMAPFMVGTNRTSLRDRTRMKFLSIQNSEGLRFFPAFTDEEELKKYNLEKRQQAVHLTFDDYARIVLDGGSAAGGFVINPFGENLIFDRATVLSLRKQKLRREKSGGGEDGTRVRIGQPKEVPDQMLKAVSEYLETQQAVKAAYLSLMQKEGEDSCYLFVIDSDEAVPFDEIAKTAQPYLHDIMLHIQPVHSDLGKAAATDRTPFYKKK